MKKTELSFENIQQLHRTGCYEEAKHSYLDFLQAHPDHQLAWHFLGILYAEEGDLDAAQHCLEKTIQLNATDPVPRLHLANILKAKGLYGQAIDVLLTVLEQYPHFAAAYNNLGTVYYVQENWSEAVRAYENAIAIQSDYIDAYYNWGLALIKLKKINKAITVYEGILALNAQHVGARFQLACLHMQKNQYPMAIEQLSLIEKVHPFHVETQSNLATCFLKLGQLDEAKQHYLQALKIIPNDIQTLFNLGVLHMQQGEIDKAITSYMDAVNIDPDFFAAQNNLGVAFLALKNQEKALYHFREAARIEPKNEAIQHTVNILTQKKDLSTSPLSYVQSLFDSYADHYEAHLLQALHYEVPQWLYDIVQESQANLHASSWDILDLGCGTGLCGKLFKPLAHTLVGVDISAKMLEQAAQKHIYDELVQADILRFASAKKDSYDLIIAGDVIVYFGDLMELFSTVHKALKRNGLFVFNAEQGQKNDYEMTNSGRFVHRKQYIEQLVEQAGFTIMQYREHVMRTQQHEPVRGHIYLLQK